MRYGLVALVLVLAAPFGLAQSRGPAAPPDKGDLDRLNLKSEWTAFLPLQGGRDGVATVQLVDGGQVFAQSRSGLLVAFDAVTGARQWAYRYPAGYVNTYPVGVNEDFVFAVNVARLLGFNRYSGVVEFDFELPGTPTSGPVADRDAIYVTVNGTKLSAYEFPQVLKASRERADRLQGRQPLNAADAVAARYGNRANFSTLSDEEFTRPYVPKAPASDSGLGPNQRTPSITALPSVSPPYTLDNRGLYVTPAITMVPSMRQPYQLKPEYLRYNQRTPSVSTIPPSIARAAELSNFRPRGIEPTLLWGYTSGRRFANEPLLTDGEGVVNSRTLPPITRIWLPTDTGVIEAIDKVTHRSQIQATLQDRVASPMTGPARVSGNRLLGFVGLVDGNVVAMNLLAGGPQGPRVEWRASVGGYMNHRPIATRDAVFASGEQSGSAKIDIESGEVLWRTEAGADRVVAVNDEFVYVRTRGGDLAIYDRQRPSNPATGRSTPLGRLNTRGFDVNVTNERNDRIFLVADSGLIVCLRDASAKYVRPVPLIPPPAPPAKKPDPVDPAAPPAEEPKKDAPKVEAPKKG